MDLKQSRTESQAIWEAKKHTEENRATDQNWTIKTRSFWTNVQHSQLISADLKFCEKKPKNRIDWTREFERNSWHGISCKETSSRKNSIWLSSRLGGPGEEVGHGVGGEICQETLGEPHRRDRLIPWGDMVVYIIVVLGAISITFIKF